MDDRQRVWAINSKLKATRERMCYWHNQISKAESELLRLDSKLADLKFKRSQIEETIDAF